MLLRKSLLTLLKNKKDMDKDQLQTYSLSLTKNLIESAKNRALELGLTYGLNPSVSLYVRRLIEKDVMESKLKNIRK